MLHTPNHSIVVLDIEQAHVFAETTFACHNRSLVTGTHPPKTCKIYCCCRGSARLGYCRFGHAYDADLALWNFSPHGPFAAAEDLKASPLLRPLADGLRFTVVS